MRRALSDASTSSARTSVVTTYLTDMKVIGEMGEVEEAFRDFLLKNDSVELPADTVETILALREDRRWRGVSTASELKRALATGEADSFLEAYKELADAEKEYARDAALDELRSSRQRLL